MIEMKEILKNYKLEDQPKDVQENLAILLERVNRVRKEWGKPMTVTSGLRMMADHLRIYREQAARDGRPFDESKVPKASKHLYGQAVDIADPKGELMAWLKARPEHVKDYELWFEDGTIGWVHCQIVPPGSGKRWFLP